MGGEVTFGGIGLEDLLRTAPGDTIRVSDGAGNHIDVRLTKSPTFEVMWAAEPPMIFNENMLPLLIFEKTPMSNQTQPIAPDADQWMERILSMHYCGNNQSLQIWERRYVDCGHTEKVLLCRIHDGRIGDIVIDAHIKELESWGIPCELLYPTIPNRRWNPSKRHIHRTRMVEDAIIAINARLFALGEPITQYGASILMARPAPVGVPMTGPKPSTPVDSENQSWRDRPSLL